MLGSGDDTLSLQTCENVQRTAKRKNKTHARHYEENQVS